MPFLGRFEAKLDDKNRMAIPAKYRDQFDAPAYLTSGEESCIKVFTKAAYERKAEKVNALPDDTPDGRNARRRFFGDSADVTKDAQGRLLIPASLIGHAGLDKDLAIVGAGDWFEIWDPQRYRDYLEGGA
jgi:MraZ protein